jgi:hypothetical protein
MPDRALAAGSQLSQLRGAIERLYRVDEHLYSLGLLEEASKLLEAALQVSYVYDELLQVAAQCPTRPRPGALRGRRQEVPF